MTAYGTVTEVRTVRIECLLPRPIERIWADITEYDERFVPS